MAEQKYRREVVPMDQLEAKVVALLNVAGSEDLLLALLRCQTFVSLVQPAPNWYRAQFGLIENGDKDPLKAMAVADLRDKGYEVIG